MGPLDAASDTLWGVWCWLSQGPKICSYAIYVVSGLEGHTMELLPLRVDIRLCLHWLKGKVQHDVSPAESLGGCIGPYVVVEYLHGGVAECMVLGSSKMGLQ
ncbi:hypothetical protein NDU88_001606 [Pleurodeles waltl]|uniref:Uncharacterized protein n=1 Tax=Pleurodeles waltl TaxID=8319 RepID=A0AAV7RBC9_PLEWA|nr:hypothetical protein NDU88_001606 [Pleurodeles waltl]